MAKLLKSFFSTDKRKSGRDGEGEEDGKDFNANGRRVLSISRSGRMKQANKKRSSLTLDVYGEDIQTPTKPKAREYHVNAPIHAAEKTRRHSLEHPVRSEKAGENRTEQSERKDIADVIKTPEEEIELAFEIIDKVS